MILGAVSLQFSPFSVIFLLIKVSVMSSGYERERRPAERHADMFYLAIRSLSGPGDCLGSGGVKCRC